MNFTLAEKHIKILKILSQIALGFTFIVAVTMIFSLVQLKTINPLDNPVLLSVKEQYDRDPANAQNAEQVRAMDLMARKAYFSSRWQVESGSYLLLAGAIIFIICQQLISSTEKTLPSFSEIKPETESAGKAGRKYLLTFASVVFIAAIGATFFLRAALPDPGAKEKKERNRNRSEASASVLEADAVNYPFFRGQDSRGIAGGEGYATEWNGSESKNIAWKAEVPKEGQNSPVIWKDKLFLSGGLDKDVEVYCYDKNSGKLLWTGKASGLEGEPSGIPEMDADGGLSTSTLAVNEKYVCAIFANGNLACFDHDGKSAWSKNIGLPANVYGYASSLLIYKDLLIVQYDSDAKLSLMGINLKNGEVKWETPRTGRPVWSSPVIAYFSGSPCVIINGNPDVEGYDPETGKQLWAVECMSGDVAPSVAANSQLVYAETDYAKLAAIKPGPGASIVWEDNMFVSNVSSPVANDQYLFISNGVGDAACYNAMKGDTLWTHIFDDPFYASPIIAGDKVYMLDRSGVMHIVSAGPEFKLIAESPLGERADCTPAFSEGKIFIRGKKNLYCIAGN